VFCFAGVPTLQLSVQPGLAAFAAQTHHCTPPRASASINKIKEKGEEEEGEKLLSEEPSVKESEEGYGGDDEAQHLLH
jgi:hypothetical protein